MRMYNKSSLQAYAHNNKSIVLDPNDSKTKIVNVKKYIFI